jgi:NAD(P)-dependent dehydrogenase (short-subunit alcohol dehydrogenase family)
MTARTAWNATFNTNVTSTHLMITALMPLLFAAASSPVQTRILFITSMSGSHDWCCNAADHPINAPPTAGWPKPLAPSLTSYRASKTAVGMMYREWCRTLANDPITCHLICPGHIATNLGGGTPEQAKQMGAEDPALAGRFVTDVVEGRYDEHAGLNGHLISRYIQGQPVGW